MLHNPNAQAQRATFPECLMKTNLQHPQQKYPCCWYICSVFAAPWRNADPGQTKIRLSHRVQEQGFGTGNFLPACTSWRVAAGGEEGKEAEAPQPCPDHPAQSVAVLHQGQREPWHHGAGTSWLPPAPPASPVSSGNRALSPEHSSCNLFKQKCTSRLST